MHIEDFQAFMTGLLAGDYNLIERWQCYVETKQLTADQVEQTVTELEKILADPQHPFYSSALHLRARLHRHGVGGPKDISAAIALLDQAIALGNTHAMNLRALIYQRMGDTKANHKCAIDLFLKAAEQGNAFAMNNLGWLYQEGLGVPKSIKLAKSYFEQAIDLKHALAMVNLGLIYCKGLGQTQIKLKKGIELIDCAVALGDPIAMDCRADLYHGDGKEKEAFLLLKEAAECCPGAMMKLGLHYLNGWGCEVNHHKAAELIDKARFYGFSEAQSFDMEQIKQKLLDENQQFNQRQLKRTFAISRLDNNIKDLQEYGVYLAKSDAQKGQMVVDLGRRLKGELNGFVEQLAQQSPSDVLIRAFNRKIDQAFNDKQTQLETHREIWKPIAGNIAIALTGIGLIILLIKLYLQEEPLSFNRSLFFAKTNSEQYCDEIKTAMSEITCESVTLR